MSGALKAPFPWFGGKSRVADVVWQRFGDVPNYVEPFFGSGAVLLGRPGGATGTETVNDLDGFVANFWRAVSMDAETVWRWADSPVNECDLHARHLWLLDRKAGLPERLMADPEFCDAQIAGWWVWGICSWIGSGWCSGDGPWRNVDGAFQRSDAGQGVNRQRPHLGDAGQGVNRQRPHLGDAGQGVNRQRPHLGNAGPLTDLAVRLRNVRVCCGDWLRVLGDAPTVKLGMTAVFLDPPYAVDDRAHLYTEESFDVAHDVRDWCIENGGNLMLRIALCGYEEHDELAAHGWTPVGWKAHGGYGSQGSAAGRENAHREVVWFSPYCLDTDTEQQSLFGDEK
jgi:DNA adenine methylase